MEVIRSATRHLTRAAVHGDGQPVRYADLLARATHLATQLAKGQRQPRGQHGERVAIMAPPGRDYVEATWGAWLTRGIAVPLCLSHPNRELSYMLEDSEASVVLAAEPYAAQAAPLARAAGARLLVLDEAAQVADQQACASSLLRQEQEQGGQQSVGEATAGHVALDWLASEQGPRDRDGALIIYTSGTTGRPKGALHTHSGLAAQIQSLTSAWEWAEGDRILHALPLHHIHGIVNALYCAHAAGACVEFQPKFSPSTVWEALQRQEDPVTVMMGVPTMYSYLLSHLEQQGTAEQQRAGQAAARLRLTVSGSSACPQSLMQRWEELSGTRLLERYGMTETGMVLSNPYRGERRPGSVGLPLPSVQARAAQEADSQRQEGVPSQGPGELQVRGPSLFSGYWNRPDATAEAFTPDGWFCTGDTAAAEGQPPYWRILGRTSVDIIKSGGYKVSALEVESALAEHPGVQECAVLGVPDEAQGELVAAVVACKTDQTVTLKQLQRFAGERLPPYQVPKRLAVLDSLPRNAMGKINKKQLLELAFKKSP